MLTPDLKEFERLAAAGHTLVPVARTISADLETPVSAFLSVAAKEPYAFLLESVEGGEHIGRYTFLGARPYMVVEAREGEVAIIQIKAGRERKRAKQQGSAFEVLARLLAEHRVAQIAGLPPFTAGAVGYFAYDAVRRLEKLPARAKDDLHLPDCTLMFFDRLLAFDHVKHQLHLIAAVDVREAAREGTLRAAYGRAADDLEKLERALAAGIPQEYRARQKPATKPLKTHSTTKRERFLKSVGAAKE